MTNLSEQYVKDLLAGITDPYSGSDLISLGWLRGIGIDDKRISVDLRAGFPIDGIRDSLAASIAQSLESDEAIEKAAVSLDWKVTVHAVQGELKPIEQIFRERWSRQILHSGQPRFGLAGGRSPGWDSGCRYLWAQHATHAGCVR